MTRLEAWGFHLANLLVGASGLVYAAMLYLMEATDEFALVHHPLQPLVLHVHLWTAPLLVFAVGVVWKGHAWACQRRGPGSRRISGRTLLVAAAPMALSGVLLQTAVDPDWQRTWRTTHLIASALWLVASSAHVVGAWRARQRSRSDAESERIGA